MNDEAGRHIGDGLCWFGFWLMIGLANFGERPIQHIETKGIVEKVEVLLD